jgi:hypothetical protein
MYFYSNGKYGVTIRGNVIYTDGHVLYRFSGNMQEPTRYSDVDTGLHSVANAVKHPTLFISKTGRFHMYEPNSGLWTTSIKCKSCPEGMMSAMGSTGLVDCKCSSNLYLSIVSNTCQPRTTKCPTGYYISDAGDATSDITCTICTKCAPGRFRDVSNPSYSGCTGSTDTILQNCRICKHCGIGNYISNHDTCTASSQDHCKPCKTCLMLQYITDHCTGAGTIDTQTCANCVQYCVPGSYIAPLGVTLNPKP